MATALAIGISFRIAVIVGYGQTSITQDFPVLLTRRWMALALLYVIL